MGQSRGCDYLLCCIYLSWNVSRDTVLLSPTSVAGWVDGIPLVLHNPTDKITYLVMLCSW